MVPKFKVGDFIKTKYGNVFEILYIGEHRYFVKSCITNAYLNEGAECSYSLEDLENSFKSYWEPPPPPVVVDRYIAVRETVDGGLLTAAAYTNIINADDAVEDPIGIVHLKLVFENGESTPTVNAVWHQRGARIYGK